MTPHPFQLFPVAEPPRVEIASPAAPGTARELPDAGVDLWVASAGELEPWRAELAAGLDAEERARRDRLVREVDRRQYEIFHGAVRAVLAGYLGLPPADLRFETGPHGKPRLAGPAGGLAFNLSHSGDRLLLACARGRTLGVDVERRDRANDLDGVAARFFHPDECAALAALPAAARRERFLRWWTAREAWLKAHGTGLTEQLAALDFSGWAEGAWTGLAEAGGARWLAGSFGAEDWVGALVTEAAPRVMRWRPVGRG